MRAVIIAKKKEKKEKKSIAEEKKHNSAEKAEKKKNGFPAYIAILLIIFGIVAGLVIYSVFLSKPAQLPDGSANKGSFEEIPVEFAVFYDSDCNICYQASALEVLLRQKNVKFTETPLDVRIKENGVSAGQYGMTVFPSTLLKWKQLKLANLQLYNTLKALFSVDGDYMIIPEADLLKEMQISNAIPVIFMEAPTEERCGVKNGTVRIEEFRDYFSQNSYENQGIIEQLKKDLNQKAEVYYRNFPSSEQAKKASMAAECAREQGMREEYGTAIYSALFEESRNISDTNVLKQIAREQKVPDINAFDYCIDTNKTMAIVEKDLKEAQQYKLYYSPSVVLDCVITTIETTNIGKQVCALHPDFEVCKAE